MKKYIIVIVVLLLLGLLGGTYMFNKPLENISTMKTDFQMDASSLLAAFEENETSANTKFLDKVIEIKGIVQKSENKDGKHTIYIDADNAMSGVIFQLEDAEEGIKVGDEITLKGICTGYLMDVVLVRAKKV